VSDRLKHSFWQMLWVIGDCWNFSPSWLTDKNHLTAIKITLMTKNSGLRQNIWFKYLIKPKIKFWKKYQLTIFLTIVWRMCYWLVFVNG
jgi:hypothetical protein